MSLTAGQVNALNVLGLRKLYYIPAHFIKIPLAVGSDIMGIDIWIYKNLSGRYVLKKTSTQTEKAYILAFEEQNEATFAILACPFINK
jgi:hypothetical protein